MSVRRIPMNYRNITGFVPNPVGDEPIGFESGLECEFALLASFNPELSYCDSQPLRVFWKDGKSGKMRRYTPDFLIRFRADGNFLGRRTNRPWIVEVKPKSKLLKYRAEYVPAFQAAAQEAHRLGMYFKIFTEHDIRTPMLDNVRFFMPFRDINPDPALLSLVLSSIAQLPNPTLRDVVTAMCGEHDRGLVLQSLWHLVATYQAVVNFRERVEMTSSVCVRRTCT